MLKNLIMFNFKKMFNKLPKYRIRIEELNNGSKKFFPEVKTTTFGYSQLVFINGNVAVVEGMTLYFNNTEDEAAKLINLHDIAEINKRINDTKKITVVPYIPKHNATEIPLPRAQKRGYEHPVNS